MAWFEWGWQVSDPGGRCDKQDNPKEEEQNSVTQKLRQKKKKEENSAQIVTLSSTEN